jgi:hypothetical protein
MWVSSLCKYMASFLHQASRGLTERTCWYFRAFFALADVWTRSKKATSDRNISIFSTIYLWSRTGIHVSKPDEPQDCSSAHGLTALSMGS